ncbi:hypothetical protein [Frigoriglobus tundricola]|uniref:Uncharacterized protein n=1 Tax=Frigoriglobus tundricola TaxID=2774151 RepID=A0A6M5YR85_9BACT|nr:hypothetical protein [Frigoriglobus tundricola]QJW95940.1 hypothetical protein FTUN_3494 [Frigoriglobus tundricola]
MPQDAKCPKCAHLFPVTEARQAFTVACPRCDADMTVEFKKPAAPPDAGQAPYDVVVKPGALPDGTASLKAARRRSDDDDSESAGGGGGGSVLIVVFSGVLGLLFVIGGLGATGWVLFTQIDTSETTSNWSSNRNNNKGNSSPGNNNQGHPGNNTGKTGGGETAPPLPLRGQTGFDLRPVSGGGPSITPPPLTDNVTPLDLPGRVGQIAVGGGGRYIVMHFPDKGQLGVLDVATAVSQFVEADRGDRVRIAAGQSRVVLFSPDTNAVQVFALPDLNKVAETPFPMSNCQSIAMGSRTNGPVLAVSTSGDVVLADVTAGGVKLIEGSSEKLGVSSNNLRAAPDGTAFTAFDGVGANKVKVLTELGRKWKVTEMGPAPFPGGDGHFYGNGTAFNRTALPVIPTASGTWYVPAISGSGGDFVKLAASDTATGKRVALTFHAGRNPNSPVPGTPLMVGPEIDNLMDARGNIAPDKAPDQHLFYSPEAKLLVLLAGNRTRFLLRKTNAN